MKTAAYILLVLGTVAALTCILTFIGGGAPGPAAGTAISFLMSGWKLRALARLTSKGSPASQGAGTIELPLTPEIAALFRTEHARRGRIMHRIIRSGALLFLAVGAAGGIVAASWVPFLLCALMGAAFAAIVGVIWILLGDKATRRDLASSSYLRSAGPVEIARVGASFMTRVADRTFSIEPVKVYPVLKDLRYATVDHTPHAHLVLAVWDDAGNNVYRMAGYHAS